MADDDGAHCQGVNDWSIVGDPDIEWLHLVSTTKYTIAAGPTTLYVGYFHLPAPSILPTRWEEHALLSYRGAGKPVTFTALPDHTYTLKTTTPTFWQGWSIGRTEWDYQVIDKATGDTVAATHDLAPAATQPAR